MKKLMGAMMALILFPAMAGASTYTFSPTPKDLYGTEDLTYTFSSLGLIDDLTLYAENGNLGFAFDPDCHYYNKGITLEITTAPVPEPATLLLLGSGLLGLVGVRRRGKRVAG